MSEILRQHRKKVVLAIESDPAHLQNIRALIEGNQLILDTAQNGEEVELLLQQKEATASTIIMERRLKDMDGLQILGRLKKHPLWHHIPVVMLNSDFKEEDIVECVDAGAHYYLPKPYKEVIFLSILNRAITDYTRYKFYIDKVKNAQIAGLIRRGSFSFRTLKEGHEIADWLASLCSSTREDIVVGFIELLINAVEHGNLGIGFDQKSDLLKKGDYIGEILRRLDMPEHCDKWVQVEFEKSAEDLRVRIVDQGLGFDYGRYLFPDKKRLFLSHGRGIAMAKGLYFDELEYRGSGNEVSVRVRFRK